MMYDSSDSFEGNWLTRVTVSKQNNAGCANERSKVATCLVMLATIFDVIIVLGVATIEYFFRWIAVLPLRNKQFQYYDINYTQVEQAPVSEFDNFLLKGNIPEMAVYIYSFCVPIFVIIIGELILFCMANQTAKLLPTGMCSPLHIPHTIRRLYRFSLCFLFGILCLMVIIDVLKISIGELRPNFLSLCRPKVSFNTSRYSSSTEAPRIYWSSNYELCKERDLNVVRKAKTSCPSMRSAISMYGAIYVTIYLHGIGKIHHCKYLLIPFLNMTLILLSLICGITLVGLKENWWTDIIIGYLLGASVALYLCTVVLRQFRFQEQVSNRRILRQIALLQSGSRSKDAKEHKSKGDCLIEPVRLRKSNMQNPLCPCHSSISPPPPNIFKPNSDEISTFFPFNKPNRKSVTLPINSPHIPITRKPFDNRVTENGRTKAADNRLSAINLPFRETKNNRNSIMNQNFPKISQELINMLNAKQETVKPERELADHDQSLKSENPLLQFV